MSIITQPRQREEWVLCPQCRRGKVLRLRPETRATELEVYCKRCNRRSILDIDAQQLRGRPA